MQRLGDKMYAQILHLFWKHTIQLIYYKNYNYVFNILFRFYSKSKLLILCIMMLRSTGKELVLLVASYVTYMQIEFLADPAKIQQVQNVN